MPGSTRRSRGCTRPGFTANDYPNQFLNQDGVVSSIPGPFGTTLISTSDAQFATQAITIPLNNAIAAAATKFNWTFVDLLPGFSTHGYPSTALRSASSTNRSTIGGKC